ncbi:uncharacterized protein si:dkey-112e17.1 [Pristis pectinata]|uniref:uncharacterized protein si:dkey-112e17.1 n=1 Tax=Pristis pectinata TaxID=685728 RepID=UPI00223D223C|nr:uncharacterized protein si:dkey-112e17.1 [Pristis pectinata]
MAGKLVRIATLVTTCSIWAAARTVYYSCGAVVDSEAQGVILSPGFPTRYAPGTHCVWQFFIPPGVRLDLEVFDFDVFESPGNDKTPPRHHSAPGTVSQKKGVSGSAENGVLAQGRESPNRHSPVKETTQGGRIKILFNEINASDSKSLKVDHLGTSVKSEDKQGVAQKELVKVLPQMDNFSVTDSPLSELVEADSTKSNLSAALTGFGDYRDIPSNPQPNTEQQGGERLEMDQLKLPEGEDSAGAKVLASVPPEVCPDDVLYISDLITFSVRFCGANSPVNKTLTFGSPLEMVEVVVELITTTDQGRGFLLLYHFEGGLDVDLRNPLKLRGHDNLIHFLVIGGIALLLAVLLTAVCRTWRRRTHYKRRCSHCSKNRENGIQNSAVDIGEMQLVANRTNQDVLTENENNNHSISLGRPGNSLHTEMEVTSTESAVTESGSDEIFVISAGPSVGTLHFSSFKTKVPKRSPASSPTVCDWLVPDLPPSYGEKPPMAQTGNGRRDSPTGQQGCNTQQDVLRPLPRDWCGWTSTGPFAKLVGNCTTGSLLSDHHNENQRKVMSDMQLEADWEQLYTDSSGSTASYPLTRSAQSQRKVTSATNLRRAWFGSPCFGFRPGASLHNSSTAANSHNWARQSVPQHGPCGEGPRPLVESTVSNNIKGFQIDGAKTRHLATESDRINLTKPVFVISEASEDREPLVQALDTVGQSADISHFAEIKPDKSNPASEEQRLTHPVTGAS